MTRAFSSSWSRLQGTLLWALLLIALTASSALAGKPTVAILGLEVYDPSGNIDTPTTTVARDLTEGLRSRAKSGTGPYQLATGSDKELIDEKLINNCDSEAIACMSEIGKNLGADYLIYGRLEKKADGYVVTINLLNVGKKKFEKTKTPLMIPFAQKDGPAIAAAARKAYNDLTGVAEAGTLVIKANAPTGKVLIDDEPRGTLSGGSATIGQLPEGRYRVAIESDGFQRSPEVTVTIRSGETTNQPVTLVATSGSELQHEITGSTSTSKGMNVWKPIFGVAVVAGLASGGYWAYSYIKSTSAAEDVRAELDAFAVTRPNHGYPIVPGPKDCGNSQLRDDIPSFESACSNRDGTKYGIIGVSISAVAIAVTGFLAFRGGDETESRPAASVARRTKKKPQFSVTPIVSADGGGATFQLDW